MPPDMLHRDYTAALDHLLVALQSLNIITVETDANITSTDIANAVRRMGHSRWPRVAVSAHGI